MCTSSVIEILETGQVNLAEDVSKHLYRNPPSMLSSFITFCERHSLPPISELVGKAIRGASAIGYSLRKMLLFAHDERLAFEIDNCCMGAVLWDTLSANGDSNLTPICPSQVGIWSSMLLRKSALTAIPIPHVNSGTYGRTASLTALSIRSTKILSH